MGKLGMGMLGLAALFLAAASAPPARVVDRIPGLDGDYDYVSVDPALGRVFVARGDGVMAIDLARRKRIDRLVPGKSVSAVLPIPDSRLMLSTNYDADEAMLFDRATGRVVARVPTGKSPDAAAYDPATRLVLVMNAKGASATLVDPRAKRAVGTIALGGKPEAGVADGRGRAYVNLEDRAAIAVVDVARRRVVARYRLAGCVEPTGIAYDPVTGLLASACHNGVAKLTDARTGADRGGFAIGKDADGMIFDAARRLLFVPSFDGQLVIATLDRAGHARRLQSLPTQVGARTAALDPTTGRLYLPTPRYPRGADAESKPIPGSFAVLVVATR